MSNALPGIAGAWQQSWPWVVMGGGATLLAGRVVLNWLKRRQILDLPNERSSHTLPTPRGGGLATSPVMAVLMGLMGFVLSSPPLAMLGAGALVLLAISWIDDRRGLPPLPRFLIQTVTIGLAILALPGSIVSDSLPWWLDHLLAGLGWLWFVNLYNFMDGIDGITGTETISLGLGVAVVVSVGGAAADLIPAGLTLAAIAAAFLTFNWHPARMFLGDSGSVPFGFVLGGLLALLASQGHLAAALILPAYYLADATITLIRRALNGERVWQAHRKHFYQRAVQGGKRHDQVVRTIAAGNILLIGAAGLAAGGGMWTGLAAAAAIIVALLALLQRWSRGEPS